MIMLDFDSILNQSRNEIYKLEADSSICEDYGGWVGCGRRLRTFISAERE